MGSFPTDITYFSLAELRVDDFHATFENVAHFTHLILFFMLAAEIPLPVFIVKAQRICPDFFTADLPCHIMSTRSINLIGHIVCVLVADEIQRLLPRKFGIVQIHSGKGELLTVPIIITPKRAQCHKTLCEFDWKRCPVQPGLFVEAPEFTPDRLFIPS